MGLLVSDMILQQIGKQKSSLQNQLQAFQFKQQNNNHFKKRKLSFQQTFEILDYSNFQLKQKNPKVLIENNDNNNNRNNNLKEHFSHKKGPLLQNFDNYIIQKKTIIDSPVKKLEYSMENQIKCEIQGEVQEEDDSIEKEIQLQIQKLQNNTIQNFTYQNSYNSDIKLFDQLDQNCDNSIQKYEREDLNINQQDQLQSKKNQFKTSSTQHQNRKKSQSYIQDSSDIKLEESSDFFSLTNRPVQTFNIPTFLNKDKSTQQSQKNTQNYVEKQEQL